MLHRRTILTGLLALTAAAPALAQNKKGGGGIAAPNVAGQYAARGMNPDGSRYDGAVSITQQGNAVEVSWVVGAQSYYGRGVIEGRVMTVDWGAATPVVYVWMPDGSLHGTWDNGTALERLTRQ